MNANGRVAGRDDDEAAKAASNGWVLDCATHGPYASQTPATGLRHLLSASAIREAIGHRPKGGAYATSQRPYATCHKPLPTSHIT